MVNAWIVFHWQINPGYVGTPYETLVMPSVVGVYDTEALAVAACTTSYHYLFPMVINQTEPEAPHDNPLAWYPIGQAKP
jgi:hypothetical protein